MGKYCRKYIGMKFKMRDDLGGYEVEVIDGGDRKDYVYIKFTEPTEYIKEIRIDHIKRGNVKNLYHPDIFDKGYIGIGKYKKGSPQYIRWKSMLCRVYYDKFNDIHTSYKNVLICDEWHNLQNYGKWDDENYIEGWQLDKDLLSKEQKIYSPETCCFIPQELNKFMTNIQQSNANGYIGARWHKRDKIWESSISINGKKTYLGRFNTEKEAHKAYQEVREGLADGWRIKARKLGIDEKIIKNIK